MSEPTRYRLARDLEAAGAPSGMVVRARSGAYDDYLSPSAFPLTDLVRDLVRWGADSAPLTAIADAVRAGAYDATAEEAAAWRQSDEGRAAWRELTGETPG